MIVPTTATAAAVPVRARGSGSRRTQNTAPIIDRRMKTTPKKLLMLTSRWDPSSKFRVFGQGFLLRNVPAVGRLARRSVKGGSPSKHGHRPGSELCPRRNTGTTPVDGLKPLQPRLKSLRSCDSRARNESLRRIPGASSFALLASPAPSCWSFRRGSSARSSPRS